MLPLLCIAVGQALLWILMVSLAVTLRRLGDSAKAVAARQALKPAPPAVAVCGCTHHYAFHDLKASRCRAVDCILVQGAVIRLVQECRCQQYTGPEPLPMIYAA